jgi:hypothetical protein
MRRLYAAALVVSLGAAAVACGGNRAIREGARMPDEATSAAGESRTTALEPATSQRAPSQADALPVAEAAEHQDARSFEDSGASRPASDAGIAPRSHAHDVGRSPEDIRAIVAAHRDEARACYDAAEKQRPGIGGNLVMTWTISPKGEVTQASIDATRSQVDVPALTDCICAMIRGVQFAASPGGYETKASYPFVFRPRRSREAAHSP